MKELCHTNVISLRHAFYTQGDKVSAPLAQLTHLSIFSKMRFT